MMPVSAVPRGRLACFLVLYPLALLASISPGASVVAQDEQTNGPPTHLTGSIRRLKGLNPVDPGRLPLEVSGVGECLTSDGGYLFLVRGDRLYKISESSLLVLKSAVIEAVTSPTPTRAGKSHRPKRHRRKNAGAEEGDRG